MINITTGQIKLIIKQLAPILRELAILLENIANDPEINKLIVSKNPAWRQLFGLARYKKPDVITSLSDPVKLPNDNMIQIVTMMRDLIAWSIDRQIDQNKGMSLIEVSKIATEEMMMLIERYK